MEVNELDEGRRLNKVTRAIYRNSATNRRLMASALRNPIAEPLSQQLRP